MKKFFTALLVLVVFLGFSGISLSESECSVKLKTPLKKQAILESAKATIEKEIERLTPIAVEKYKEAEEIMKNKSPAEVTKDEMIIILTAALLVEKIHRMQCQLGLINWELNKMDEEKEKLIEQYRGEKEC